MAIMMTKPLKLFITAILLLFTFNIFAATFSAQINVNPVLLSDSFQLTYIAEGSVDDDPDFSPAIETEIDDGSSVATCLFVSGGSAKIS